MRGAFSKPNSSLEDKYTEKPFIFLLHHQIVSSNHIEAVVTIWGGIHVGKDELIINNARKLIDAANEKGLFLRVTGAIAIRIHCPKFGHLLSGSRVISDIDFVAYGKQINRIEKHMEESGYELRPPSIASLAARRRIFYDRENGITVDVFFDKLEMSHDIDFRGRLEVDYPTIPLAEMLLAKVQIVQLNEKDVKDVIILLREHEIADGDKELINAKYVAKTLSNDWGFYYTATTNLKKVKDLLGNYGNLVNNDKELIISKIDRLLDIVEKEPKSFNWKLRARVGTKRVWYRTVEEIGH
jgi:hypothetical protein